MHYLYSPIVLYWYEKVYIYILLIKVWLNKAQWLDWRVTFVFDCCRVCLLFSFVLCKKREFWRGNVGILLHREEVTSSVSNTRKGWNVLIQGNLNKEQPFKDTRGSSDGQHRADRCWNVHIWWDDVAAPPAGHWSKTPRGQPGPPALGQRTGAQTSAWKRSQDVFMTWFQGGRLSGGRSFSSVSISNLT